MTTFDPSPPHSLLPTELTLTSSAADSRVRMPALPTSVVWELPASALDYTPRRSDFARDMGCGLLMENVTGLLDRGFGDVLGALAESGFDAIWRAIPARHAGADHQRERLWIVAYPSGARWKGFEPDHGLLERAAQALAQHGDTAFGEWRALVSGQHVLRNVDGLSVAMERRRLHAVGNAVTPYIPEAIGRAILESMRAAA